MSAFSALRKRLRRERHRVAEVPDDLPDLLVVEAADLVDLLDEPAVALHQPRIELVLFLEALEVGHRHAVVQVVRARGEDVLTVTRCLAGDHRLEVRIEEHPRVRLDALRDRLALFEIEPGAVRRRNLHRLDHALAIEIEQELSRRQVVVRAGVEPEQLGVARQLLQRRLGNAARMTQDLLEQPPNAQVMTMALVVIDVAAGERGLIQVPDERLVSE